LISLSKNYWLKTKDLNQFCGIFFINYSICILNKFIELKLLNYLKTSSNLNKTFIHLNSNANSKFYSNLNSKYNIYNYFYLPNSVFFEISGTYLNVQGIFKKSIKMLPLTQNIKNDWQILRKLNNHIKNLTFISNPLFNLRINFNSKTLYFFKNYINYLNYSNYIISPKAFYLLTKTKFYNFKNFKFYNAKIKAYNFKFRNLINDFYLNDFDLSSNFSVTMIECSYSLRLAKLNFSNCF